jgi:hypothetical protein
MNSYKCVEKIKNSIYVCKAFPNLFIVKFIYIYIYIILNIDSLSPFS